MILVTCADNVRTGDFKELYRNTIELDDSISFDYSKVIEVLTLLYRQHRPIIEFKLFSR